MKRLAILSLASLSGCFFILGFQKPLTCGDGILTEALGEECDDGNQSAANGLEQFNDSCEATCTIPRCGDGVQQPFATSDSNGDGLVNFADQVEQCDDGNDINDDACANDCRLPQCGDGIQQTVPTIDTDLDGVDDTTEACDDGFTCADFTPCEPNTQCPDLSFCQVRGGDGCSQDCLVNEECGNNIVDVGEECDDGNNIDADGCEADCTDPACENGILDPGEVCFVGDFNQPVAGSGNVPNRQLADLDGDTNLDIVLANGNDIQLFFGNGDGTFSTPTTISDPENLSQVVVGNFDGDQLLDVISLDTTQNANGPAILFSKNNGARNFGAFVRDPQTITNSNALLVAGNLNGDSIDDIIDASRFAGDRFFIGNGGGTFTQTNYTITPDDVTNFDHLSLRDLDEDQDLDIVFAGSSSFVIIAVNQAPAFTFSTTLLAGDDADETALADFDGDGILDIATFSFSDLRLRLGQGGATFGAPSQSFSASFLTSISATDFDLNGTSELLLLNASSNNAAAVVFDGFSFVSTVFSSFSGGIVISPLFADINKDGIQDMVFTQNNGIGGLYLFLGTP